MIGDIVRRGPAGGIQLVLGMQRADTVYIPGEMRSNMQCKIVVGDGGNDLYKMNPIFVFLLKLVMHGIAWVLRPEQWLYLYMKQ